jgi:hypothetical protein
MNRRLLLTCVAVVAAALASGCGGAGPSSPSAGAGVEVQGVLLGDGTAFVASSGRHPSAAKAEKVIVTVEGTTITAEVGADGTFVLKGVPSGTFTLVFKVDGKEIGRIPVTAPDGAEVKVVVRVEGGVLVLVEIKIDVQSPPGSPSPTACVISGGKQGQGIELEGVVSSGTWQAFTMRVNGERSGALVDVVAASASFRCVGGAKTDTVDQCKAAVDAGGAKVHVRGTLTACTAQAAQVTAAEVKVQKN